MKKLFAHLADHIQAGNDTVLVTIVASSGSTPRGAGARMLVDKTGRICGTIGGGAVEYRCQNIALDVLKTKTSCLESFELTENQVQDLGMICGGSVTVYFFYIPGNDANTLALARHVYRLFEGDSDAWLIADITAGNQNGLAVYDKKGGLFGFDVPDSLLSALKPHAFQADVGERRFYCERLISSGKVYIFGGGHVSQALVPALCAVGFRCVVLEDRAEFCRPELFPGVEQTRLIDAKRIHDYASIGEEDYVAILTRGHKDDLDIMAQVLKTPACYIGVIGSSKKTQIVFSRLRELGFGEDDLKRFTTPIGLAIKAQTPAEVAVSITAQLILTRAERQ